jgi:transcriptional regulator with XRE-family HTH domain
MKELLCDRLIMLRKERELTLQDVAEGTGFGVPRVSSWEKQRGRTPRGPALRILAQFYNVTEKWLLGGGKREPFNGPAVIENERNKSIAERDKIVERANKRIGDILTSMARELGRL